MTDWAGRGEETPWWMRLTMFRCECPNCGHIGVASWCHEQWQVKCRECGERYDYRANTYRPATRGMTDEERAARERTMKRERRLRPEVREKDRLSSRIYYECNREKLLAKSKAYRQTEQYRKTHRAYCESHKEEIAARKRAYREAHKEEIRAYQKAYDSTPERREHNRQNARRYYQEHREEILAKRRAQYQARKKRAMEGENE